VCRPSTGLVRCASDLRWSSDDQDALRRHKKEGQSFSDVIKRHFAGRTTGKTLARVVASLAVRETTLDAADGLIDARAADRAGAADL
jgi:predicted CopG family antitoxin